ncbi:uncharacterized protein LOC132628005 isoform X1 [Lycium barbarum]|uniref:uncharacterized protein LOC132628005 isoform X1 n=1 Tax=Lycium barbarum TaxID=112863 RepID=UPI00293F156C|nr:uncharacterized protein LOC132628005 isoform X1 [Lycium barbarum]
MRIYQEMKDEEAQSRNSSTTNTVTTTPVSTIAPLAVTSTAKKDQGFNGLFGKGKYKLWVLAAILLLAFWSMFTGSLTLSLNWSTANLSRLSDTSDFSIHEDLDILVLEEREKMVKHMWDVYTQSSRIRLPKFWQDAFQAAYLDLTSDSPAIRDTAVSEIAKMSLRSTSTYESPSNKHTEPREAEKEKGSKSQAKTMTTKQKQ